MSAATYPIGRLASARRIGDATATTVGRCCPSLPQRAARTTSSIPPTAYLATSSREAANHHPQRKRTPEHCASESNCVEPQGNRTIALHWDGTPLSTCRTTTATAPPAPATTDLSSPAACLASDVWHPTLRRTRHCPTLLKCCFQLIQLRSKATGLVPSDHVRSPASPTRIRVMACSVCSRTTAGGYSSSTTHQVSTSSTVISNSTSSTSAQPGGASTTSLCTSRSSGATSATISSHSAK